MSSPRRMSPGLERGDVDGLRPLVAGLRVVGDLRALGQRLEAVGVDAGVVDEEVLATVVRRDEAEALVVVEPLHGSGRHVIPPWLVCTANAEDAARRQRLRALNTLWRRASHARHEQGQRTAWASTFWTRPGRQAAPHHLTRRESRGERDD